MAGNKKENVTFCIIEAPLLERQKLGIERIAKVMHFDAGLRRDADGKYPSFVLSLDEDNAAAIVCKILRFVPRHLPPESKCTHVAWLETLDPRDFEKVCALDDWVKIPVDPPGELVSGSSAECEDPCVLDRG